MTRIDSAHESNPPPSPPPPFNKSFHRVSANNYVCKLSDAEMIEERCKVLVGNSKLVIHMKKQRCKSNAYNNIDLGYAEFCD